MLPPEIVRQVRRLQLRARRSVENLFGGEYHSAFKGAGLTFADVRSYQPGDDVRTIDWNVTARLGQPFLKRFVEERELTVLFVIDGSASLDFGSTRLTKRQVVAELAALLAFAALHNNDRVGLLHATDRVERHVPPRKGTRHAQRLLCDILFVQSAGRRTDLGIALDTLMRTQRRRAIVFVFSDFATTGFERPLRMAGRKHDVTAVCVRDPLEMAWPDAGLIELDDAESGGRLLVDSSSDEWRSAHATAAESRRMALARTVRAANSNLLEVSTDGSHFDAVLGYFRSRQTRRRP